MEKHFEKDESNEYDRKSIECFAQKRYDLKDGQGFYRSFTGIDLTNKTAIANSFKRGYKEKLIFISGNDSGIITYLKKYPN